MFCSACGADGSSCGAWGVPLKSIGPTQSMYAAYSSELRPLPFHFLLKRRLRRNFGSMPWSERDWPLPSCIGFLMPLRWFLYDWLCAVWLVDFAIVDLSGGAAGSAGQHCGATPKSWS